MLKQHQKLLYIVSVVITVLLSYGFMVTQVSIGIDDEAYVRYYESEQLAQQGRVGYVINKFFADIYEFTPVWREILGVLIFAATVMLLAHLFYKVAGNMFSTLTATIFSVIALSFPLIAERFLFSECIFSTPFQWLLCTVGVINLVQSKTAQSKEQFVVNFLVALLCFTYAMFFEKTVVIVCVTVAFQAAIVMQCNESGVYYKNPKKLFQLLFLLIGTLIGALLLSLLGTNLILKLLHLDYVPYVEGYFMYDHSDPFRSLAVCLRSVGTMIMQNVKGNEAFHTFVIAWILFFVFGMLASIKKRNIWLALCVVGYCILPFAPYLVTANPYLPSRIMDYWSLWTGFAVASAYLFITIYLDKVKWHGIKTSIQYASIFLCGLCVIRQSYSMTHVFYLDYCKYQKDVNYMHQIIYDLQVEAGAKSQKPVVFIGHIPENEFVTESQVAGSTIFGWDRYWTTYEELLSKRIYSFFELHGYQLRQPNELLLDPCFQDNVRRKATQQSNWPEPGYVQEYEDYILVRLGQPLYEIYNLPTQEFVEKFDTTDHPVQWNFNFQEEENSMMGNGWCVFVGENDYDAEIELVLLNESENRQYILSVDAVHTPSLTEYFQDGHNYDHSGFVKNFNTDGILPGNYQVGVLLRNNGKSKIIMTNKVYHPN